MQRIRIPEYVAAAIRLYRKSFYYFQCWSVIGGSGQFDFLGTLYWNIRYLLLTLIRIWSLPNVHSTLVYPYPSVWKLVEEKIKIVKIKIGQNECACCYIVYGKKWACIKEKVTRFTNICTDHPWQCVPDYVHRDNELLPRSGIIHVLWLGGRKCYDFWH